uniref:immunoglobulin-like domain-containing protein n=1 Tax=Hyalangium gracile TaxID=394092 RepID=UPI001CCED97E
VTTTQQGNPNQPGQIIYTYSATDPSGNTVASPVTRTVTVNDNAPPTLALLGPAVQALECADPYNDPGATASDACFGDVTGRITKSGSVNNMVPDSYTVSYNVTDPAGQSAPAVSRTVNVSDTKKPVVTVIGSLNQAVECGSSYTDEGATASDACAGTLPAVASSVANPNVPNTYTISYTATDPSGNVGTSTASRTVTVSDNLPPQLALVGPANMGLECATPFTDPGATANDQCAGNLTSAIQKTGTVDNRLLTTPQVLQYTVSDGAHTASVDRTVTVSDTLPPSIALNGSPTDTFECGTAYVDPGATATDACAGAVTVVTTQQGNPDAPGQIVYTYSATDPSGNAVASPVTRTVTVNDNAPPTLALLGAATQSLECGTPYTDPGATANDACFGDVTSRIVRTGSVNSSSPASYQLTYNVTDPSGQSAPAVHRTVNVSDTLAPAITVRGPLSQSVQCGSGPYADPGATATDSCYGDLTAAIVASGSVNSSAAGNYTISYSVTDPSGNSATSADVRTVTVVDDQAPSIALNGGAAVPLECGTPFNDPGATANDLCAGNLPVTVAGAVNEKVPAAYTLTYSANDGYQNVSTNRTVTVSDTLAPTLALNGPATQAVECGGPYTDPGATATDVCAGNLDAAVQVAGAVNPAVVGNYNVSYTVSDTTGNTAGPVNRAVTVSDTLAPTIAVNGPVDQTFECGSTYVDPGATASDQCAGNLTSAIVATRTNDPANPGNFTITYSVTDPSGNTFTSPVVRTVNVDDNAAPTLVLNGPALQNLECGTPFVDPGATANDACTGDLSGAISRSGTVNSAVPADYTLIYNVADSSGNSAPSVSRTVHVADTLAPTINVTGPLNATYECRTEYVDPGATATDSCDPSVTVVATRTSNPNQPDNFIITYSATDDAGNTTVSPVTRTVTMNDNAPPSIALNGPANQTVECSPDAYQDPGATATDLCVGTVPVMVTGTVNMGVSGNYTLRYTAQDTVGNTSPTVTRNVQVIDSTGPTINLNGEVAVYVECKGEYVDQGATATDFCSPTTTITSTSNVNTNEPNAYLVTYTAKDESGNTSTAVRNVIVEDKTAPTITLNGENPYDHLECGTPYVDPGATATDSCQAAAPQVFVDFIGVDHMKEGTYEVRYRTNDNYGNQATATRDVIVDDTLGPVISLVGASEVEIECGVQPDLNATAQDACYGNVTANIVANPATLPNEPGNHTVTYSAHDGHGNTTVSGATRTYTVVDTQAPVLTVNGSTEIYYECTGHAIGNVWQNPGATATDSCQGELQVHQYNTGDDDGDGIPGDIDPDDFGPGPTTTVEGLYYVQYLAWDDSYNIQNAILSVYVQDTLPPMLTLNGEANVQTQCFVPRGPDDVDPQPYVEEMATGDDQCYGDVSPSVMVSGEVNKQEPGVYTLRYDVRDGAFNWAEHVTRSVEVIDNLSPTLTETKKVKVFPADTITMRTVDLTECAAVWDRCDTKINIPVNAYDLEITSNDPASDPNDIVVLNNHTFQVRAKLASGNQMRVYTARFKVEDASLNGAQGTCTVYVPVNDNDAPPPSAAPDFMAGR